jgi:hypothetical protein
VRTTTTEQNVQLDLSFSSYSHASAIKSNYKFLTPIRIDVVKKADYIRNFNIFLKADLIFKDDEFF